MIADSFLDMINNGHSKSDLQEGIIIIQCLKNDLLSAIRILKGTFIIMYSLEYRAKHLFWMLTPSEVRAKAYQLFKSSTLSHQYYSPKWIFNMILLAISHSLASTFY